MASSPKSREIHNAGVIDIFDNTGYQEPRPLGIEIDPESVVLWEEFCTNRQRSYQDILKLWLDPEITNPTIHQRALAVVTAPSGGTIRFTHPRLGIDQIYYNSDRTARQSFAFEPEQVDELASGVLHWLDSIQESAAKDKTNPFNALSEYQRIILDLLPIVDEDKADKLFDYFLVHEKPMPMISDIDAGYKPIRALLDNNNISQRHKLIGLDRWFAAARRELNSGADPLIDMASAPGRMVKYLEKTARKHLDDGEYEIYEAMVTFLEDNIPTGQKYIEFPQYVDTLADPIADEVLKFRLVRRHVDPDKTDYWQYSHGRASIDRAKRIRQTALGFDDTEFAARTDTLIVELDEKTRQIEAEEAEQHRIAAEKRREVNRNEASLRARLRE